MPSSQQAMLRSYEEVLKTGLPKASVLEMFAKPDFEDKARLFYSLGAQSMGPSVDTLIIEFDESGKVTGYRVSRG